MALFVQKHKSAAQVHTNSIPVILSWCENDPNNSLFSLKNFALAIVVKCIWEHADLPRAFQAQKFV